MAKSRDRPEQGRRGFVFKRVAFERIHATRFEFLFLCMALSQNHRRFCARHASEPHFAGPIERCRCV
jgi:hypothetical protein